MTLAAFGEISEPASGHVADECLSLAMGLPKYAEQRGQLGPSQGQVDRCHAAAHGSDFLHFSSADAVGGD